MRDISMPRICLAAPNDAGIVVEFSLACALESEDLALDVAQVRAGVAAALADASRGRYFLAEGDTGPVGQVMITREWSDWRNAWIWWLQSVYVRPEARRRGVFGALLQHVENVARRENAAFLRLYVDRHNAAAERIYLNRGFAHAHYRMLERSLPNGE